MDARLKELMKELGEAINDSLSESDQISTVIAKMKADGYDVFLVLEATIGFNKHEPAAQPRGTTVSVSQGEPSFRLNTQDMKFLKSLRIRLDE